MEILSHLPPSREDITLTWGPLPRPSVPRWSDSAFRARSRAEECILARRFRGWVEEGVPYAQDHVLDMVPVSWYKAAWLHAFRDMPDFFPLVKERACAPRRRYRRPFGPRKAKLSTVE